MPTGSREKRAIYSWRDEGGGDGGGDDERMDLRT
jgi:hypothetical protein